jgi:hypothetical protein
MSKGLPAALLKWMPVGEKVSGYKLQCQKVYLAALPKYTKGGEKVSGYKLQCQKVPVTFSPPVVHLGRAVR